MTPTQGPRTTADSALEGRMKMFAKTKKDKVKQLVKPYTSKGAAPAAGKTGGTISGAIQRARQRLMKK